MVLRGSRLCVGPWGSPLAEGEMRGLQEPVLRGDEGSCPPFGAPLTAPRPGWGAGFGGTRVESSLAFWDTHTHHTHRHVSRCPSRRRVPVVDCSEARHGNVPCVRVCKWGSLCQERKKGRTRGREREAVPPFLPPQKTPHQENHAVHLRIGKKEKKAVGESCPRSWGCFCRQRGKASSLCSVHRQFPDLCFLKAGA